jgi:hypothetical protein
MKVHVSLIFLCMSMPAKLFRFVQDFQQPVWNEFVIWSVRMYTYVLLSLFLDFVTLVILCEESSYEAPFSSFIYVCVHSYILTVWRETKSRIHLEGEIKLSFYILIFRFIDRRQEVSTLLQLQYLSNKTKLIFSGIICYVLNE